MSTLAIDYFPVSTRVHGSGSSSEARQIEQRVRQPLEQLKRALSFSEYAFNELEDLLNKANRENWDNLGSQPLSHATYIKAKAFLLAFPSQLSVPELTVDRDGEVNFDWFGNFGKNFSVSLRADGKLTYAGKFSPVGSTHGTNFFDDEIPEEILVMVKKLK